MKLLVHHRLRSEDTSPSKMESPRKGREAAKTLKCDLLKPCLVLTVRSRACMCTTPKDLQHTLYGPFTAAFVKVNPLTLLAFQARQVVLGEEAEPCLSWLLIRAWSCSQLPAETFDKQRESDKAGRCTSSMRCMLSCGRLDIYSASSAKHGARRAGPIPFQSVSNQRNCHQLGTKGAWRPLQTKPRRQGLVSIWAPRIFTAFYGFHSSMLATKLLVF